MRAAEGWATMDYMSEDRPGWAQRMIREREARGWSQAQVVSNLRLTYSSMNGGNEGETTESLARQWQEWELGGVKPKHWARFIAATFGTVERDLFPVDRVNIECDLLTVTGMDTAELIARL